MPVPQKMERAQFGDLEVRVVPFAAVPASRLNARIICVLGPALGPLFVAAMSGDVLAALKDMDLDKLGPTVREVFAAIAEPEAHDALMLAVFAQTTVVAGGRKHELTSVEAINRAFDGHERHLYPALWFALRVNLSRFMPGSASDADAEPQEETASPSS